MFASSECDAIPQGVKPQPLRGRDLRCTIASVSELSDRIRLAIELRGLTVNSVGERAGMARGHLTNILKSGGCSAATLLTIAKALGVTTDWLLTGEGPIERPVAVQGHAAAAPASPAHQDAAEGAAIDPRARSVGRAVASIREREATAQRSKAKAGKARS